MNELEENKTMTDCSRETVKLSYRHQQKATGRERY